MLVLQFSLEKGVIKGDSFSTFMKCFLCRVSLPCEMFLGVKTLLQLLQNKDNCSALEIGRNEFISP